jgi:hypothetical protein
MVLRVVTAAFLSIFLNGCIYLDDGTPSGPIGGIYEKPAAEARTFLEDMTIMTYKGDRRVCTPKRMGQYYFTYCHMVKGDGTVVDYYRPDGVAYRWYPGLSRPFPFRWKLEDDRSIFGRPVSKVCFKFPSKGYNPLTDDVGGTWTCEEIEFWAPIVQEVQQGDIFKLSSLRLPYTLPKEQTTLHQLLKKFPDR